MMKIRTRHVPTISPDNLEPQYNLIVQYNPEDMMDAMAKGEDVIELLKKEFETLLLTRKPGWDSDNPE